jgi:hypothetical protein
LLGIVIVALLWQLGVVPPDRLVLFGVLSVTIALVTIVLTQRTLLVRKRFVLVMVLCGLMAGVAVAGIPDAVAAGSITNGCSADATSSLDSKTPEQTSIADPFDVTGTDTVLWNAKSAEVMTNWRGSLGVDVGGFPVVIWSASSATQDLPASLSGSARVASYVTDIGGGTGITLAGIYHVYGHVYADQRTCDMSAYVRVQGAGTFAGTVNVVLWIALGALGLVIVIMAGVVRLSIMRSARGAGGTAAPEPRSTRQPPEEPARRAEGGRQKRSDSHGRSREERDKVGRTPREAARRDGGSRDGGSRDGSPDEQTTLQVHDPMPGHDPALGQDPTLGDGVVNETRAGGHTPVDAGDVGAPTTPDHGPEAPPAVTGEDKPARQTD